MDEVELIDLVHVKTELPIAYVSDDPRRDNIAIAGGTIFTLTPFLFGNPAFCEAANEYLGHNGRERAR